MNEPLPILKRMRLRYAGVCRSCGTSVEAGAWADYDRTARDIRCTACSDQDTTGQLPVPDGDDSAAPLGSTVAGERPDAAATKDIESGMAGASARREHDRRVARREQRVRQRHPKLGGLILAVTDEPQSTRAWATGAVGEVRLGKRLDALADRGVLALHDRRIPGTQANIDHIVVSSAGVFVIDAKRYKGRPHLRVEGGILRPRTETLLVGRRDCSKLVAGVIKQVALAREAILTSGVDDVPILGMMCFVEADWPLIGGSFTTGGIDVLWPKKATEKLTVDGPLPDDVISRLHRHLADTFPLA
jgi:hypothetical protein